MSKYTCGMGDPLDMLAEEASEVVKERMKWLRFGMRGDLSYTGITPYDALHQECGDFLAILVHLIMTGVLDAQKITLAAKVKQVRVKELFGTELKSGLMIQGKDSVQALIKAMIDVIDHAPTHHHTPDFNEAIIVLDAARVELEKFLREV